MVIMEKDEESCLEAFIRLGAPFGLKTITSIDRFLEGGLRPCKTYEIVGHASTGKTKICYLFLSSFIKSQQGNAVWLDPNGSFRSDKFLETLGHYIETSSALSRVFIKGTVSAEELIASLYQLIDIRESHNVGLLIIDNVGCILEKTAWTIREGGGQLQSTIINLLHALSSSGVTVLMTNHLVTWQDSIRPSLGERWRKGVQHRLLVTKQQSFYTLQHFDTGSHMKPELQFAVFKIGVNGIEEMNEGETDDHGI